MTLTVVAPAPTGDLTTLETLREELDIESGNSQDDAYLSRIITEASAACARYCRRPTFGREQLLQVERIIRPRAQIILDRDLNPSIDAVMTNGLSLYAYEWVLEGSVLYAMSGGWPSVWHTGATIEISYAAGYATVTDLPHDIERACLQTCVSLYRGRARDPLLRSETVQDVGSMAYAQRVVSESGLPPVAAALLSPWQRIAI